MPNFNLVRSINIDCNPSTAYSSLKNMNDWAKWSPWLIMDPEATVKVNDDGNSYSWEGKNVGSGNMHIVETNDHNEIWYDLTFLKPWKSKAKVKMVIEAHENGSKISWHMMSKLPFFMFWMKKMMTAYVGNDYERGLRMLKDYLEKGTIESQLKFKGENNFPGCKFIGFKRTCQTKEIAQLMEKDFTELIDYGTSKGLDHRQAFSQYLKWDMVNGKATYIAGIPYESVPEDLPSKYIKGEIPPCKIYALEHKGRYDHIGNAWSTMYAMHRNKAFKVNKKIPPFETYGNSPKDTLPKDLLATINFALK